MMTNKISILWNLQNYSIITFLLYYSYIDTTKQFITEMKFILQYHKASTKISIHYTNKYSHHKQKFRAER